MVGRHVRKDRPEERVGRHSRIECRHQFVEGQHAAEPFVEGGDGDDVAHVRFPSFGTQAITRAGLPDALSTRNAPAKMWAPRAGNHDRLARHSSAHLSAAAQT